FAGAQRKIGVAIEVIVAGVEADRPVQSVEPIGIQQNEFRSVGLGQNVTLFASFDMRAHARFWQKARKSFFRESKGHQAWRKKCQRKSECCEVEKSSHCHLLV